MQVSERESKDRLFIFFSMRSNFFFIQLQLSAFSPQTDVLMGQYELPVCEAENESQN